jgi:sensor histidine kinase YesM
MIPKLSKIRVDSFWFYQITGWLMFYSADVFLMLFVRNRTIMGFLQESLEDCSAFLFTLILRHIYKHVNYRKISILYLIIIILILSVVFTLIHYFNVVGLVYLLSDNGSYRWFLQLSQFLRWVFLLSPIYFGWSTLYFGIKLWLDWDAEKSRAEKAKRLAQHAQLQMLHYQINPHFLFNTLNSIRALMIEDSKKAKTMITELSEFLRYSLISRDCSEVSLKNELETIKHYLSIQKKRYEDKLEVTFDIDPLTENYKIFSFLIHPMIENAIKYGMQTSPMPLKIIIKTQNENGALRIKIKNSGKWINISKENNSSMTSTGTGLENVRARLENLFHGRYTFNTFEKDGYVNVVMVIKNNGLTNSDYALESKTAQAFINQTKENQ